jgi:hypothetical protein
MRILTDLLTASDILGQGISFRINDSSKAKTCIGGFLSISMLTLLLVMFLFDFQEIIDRSNARIYLEQQKSSDYSEINLNKKIFSFFFGFDK